MRTIFIILSLLLSYDCFASEPLPWQVLFQPAASPVMEELEWFHNFLLVIIFGIVFFVSFLLFYVCLRFNAKSNPIPATFSHNIALEIAWTIIPVIILIIIAVPSFRSLKYIEHPPPAELTIKVVAYQWYWHYVYPSGFEYDSYMIPDSDLKPGQKRLLDVDNRLVVPDNVNIKFLITSGDVIHSFAIPSLGIKMDAVPGRINETWTNVRSKGVYYGQCSELCGVNHGFMPIALEAVSREDFDKWIVSAKIKFSSMTPMLANAQ